VAITFDALPGQSFRGQVLEVPLQGTLTSNVVTYQVPVSLEGEEGAAILPGMTANVTVITGERTDALLLPILALQQDESGYYVILEDGTAAPVEVGLDDGTYVEVVGGLIEGDRVLVEIADTSSEGSSYGAGLERGGGMLPGGGLAPSGGMMPGGMGR